MSNFQKYVGTDTRVYGQIDLTAIPGVIYDFGTLPVPGDGRWQSNAGPATGVFDNTVTPSTSNVINVSGQYVFTTGGAPTAGTFAPPQLAYDLTGNSYGCTSPGSPGVWVALTAQSGTFAPVAAAGLLSGNYPMRNLGKKAATIRNGTAARVKWLYFGDSYAGKVSQQLAPFLVNAFGAQVGSSFSGSTGAGVTNNTSTGTVTDNTTDFTLWPSGQTTTLGSSGASRTYGVGGSSYTCDTIKVYYANVGGGFKVQVDGVDNVTPTVTSDNSLGIASIAVARGLHTVTVVQLSGSPKVIGVGFHDSTVSGVHFVGVAQGGIALNSPTMQAWTNWTAFLTDLQPDVLTFEMKEDSSWLSASLDTFLTATQAGATSADVVLIQSPPQATNDADNVAQNAIIAAKAKQYGVMTWDSYTPFGSYAKLTALGWNGDGTHVATDADMFRGLLMFRDLGIFALARTNPFDVQTANAALTTSLALGAAGATPNLKVVPSGANDSKAYVGRWLDVFSDATMSTQVARLISQANSDPWVQPFMRFGGAAYTGVKGSSDGLMLEIGNNASFGSNSQWSFFRAKARIRLKSVQTSLASNGAVTWDLSKGDPIIQPLAANATSSTFSNLYTDGHSVTIVWRQDATGGRTYTWPTNCRFAGNVAPSDTTANTETSVTLRYDATLTLWREEGRAVAVPTA